LALEGQAEQWPSERQVVKREDALAQVCAPEQAARRARRQASSAGRRNVAWQPEARLARPKVRLARAAAAREVG